MNLQDDTWVQLVVDGARGVATVEETLATVREAMAGSAPVAVDCTELTSVDLTFVQLLLAAGRSAKAAGRDITVKAKKEGPLYSALAAGGFLAAPGLFSFVEFVA